MSAARSLTVDINATIARGEWWLRLFEDLSQRAVRRREALSDARGGPLARMARAVDRVGRAVRMTLTAILWLEKILAGLAALRLRSAAEIAAARITALDRARRRGEAELRRMTIDDEDEGGDDEDEEDDGPEWDSPDRESPDRDSRDPPVDALERRLAAVDPAIVDFDDLGLRETVLRICADIGVTPDWERWEAGDWAEPDTSAAVAPAPPPIVSKSPVLPGLPGSVPRPVEMTPARRFLAALEAERWRPRLE